MFRIFGGEIQKLFQHKLFWGLLIVMLSLNCLLFYTDFHSSFQGDEEYEQLEAEYGAMDPEEAIEKATGEREFLSDLSSFLIRKEQGMSDQENLDLLAEEKQLMQENFDKEAFQEEFWEKYQNNPYGEDRDKLNRRAVDFELILGQLNYIDSYPEFISSMEEKAEEMRRISIFSQPDTFAYRNIMQTPKDFSQLQGISLQLGRQDGVVKSTSFFLSDFFVAALMLLLSVLLFSYEKEKGLTGLLRVQKKGRYQVFLSKMSLGALFCIVICLLFYGGILLMGNSLYGYGDVSRLIQSMSSFRDCSIKMTVKEYFIIFLGCKLLSSFLFFTLFSFWFLVFSDNKITYAVIAFLLAASYGCYYLIHPISFLNPLKYWNLFAFTNTYDLFANYVNLNCFGYPVDRVHSSLWLMGGFIILFCLLSVILYTRTELGRRMSVFSSLYSRLFKRKKLRGRTGIFANELYQYLFASRNCIFLLLALCLCLSSIDTQPPFLDYNSSVYQHYAEKFAGELTEENIQGIEEEKAKMDKLPEEYEKLGNDYKEKKIDQEEYIDRIKELDMRSNRMEGFSTLYNQYQRLCTTKFLLNMEENLSVLSEISTAYLFENSQRDTAQAILYLIILLIMLSSLFGSGGRNGRERLAYCTKKGRVPLLKCRCLLALGTAVLLFIMKWVPIAVSIFSNYPISDWNAPVQSIEGFQWYTGRLSVMQLVLCSLLLELITLGFICASVMAISFGVRQQNLIFLISSVLFALPLLGKLIGISLLDKITVSYGFSVFQLLSSGEPVWKFALYSAVLLLLSAAFIAGGCVRLRDRAQKRKYESQDRPESGRIE